MPLRLMFRWILVSLFLTSTLWGQTVYLKPAEALKIIFRDSAEVVSEKKTIPAERKKELEKQIGRLAKDEWTFYIARSGSKVDGYAVIDHEIGKTEPITFLTAIHPDGTVKAVEVLVFREPIGGEVHEKAFLKQYQGKKGADPVRVGQDIKNISGATMSSRAVTRGVKRDLILWDLFYGSR